MPGGVRQKDRRPCQPPGPDRDGRNLVRRRLREIYRLHEEGLRPGYDLVVVARTRAATAEYRRLEKEFLSASKELGAAL